LRRQLDDLLEQQPASTPVEGQHRDVVSPSLDQSNTKSGNCKKVDNDAKPRHRQDANDLHPNYDLLQRKFDALRKNYATVKEAYSQKSQIIKEWETYTAQLESRVSNFEREHCIEDNKILRPSNLDILIRPVSKNPTSTKPSRTSEGVGKPRISLKPSGVKNQHGPNRTVNQTPLNGTEYTDRVSERSSSTQSDLVDSIKPGTAIELPTLQHECSDEQAKIKSEPSSDTLEVVSERPVRKRKHEEPTEEAATECRVKLEDEESDPVVTGESFHFVPQSSMDLDDLGERILTPRKRTKLLSSSFSAYDDSGIGLDGASSIFINADAKSSMTPPVQPKSSSFSSALTPICGNTRKLAPFSNPSTEKPLKKGLTLGIATLADDGHSYGSGTDKRWHGTPSTSHLGKYGSRLNSLLNASTPEKPPAIVRPISGSRGNIGTPVTPLLPERRDLPFGKQTRGKPSVTEVSGSGSFRPIRNTAQESLPPPRKPIESGLRARPVSALRLDDFKINPQANDGYDFAYNEVVRSKESRACLAGCVDLNCCGKQFRALAIAQRRGMHMTPAQKAEDQQLLEDYLGDRIGCLIGLSNEEREDLLLEAKTQELANKMGKHRHRYSRMRSPPGFWRTDFPSTQEMETDKEEAVKREKEMIRERYKEAMRPGGRWLFRDE
jgi:hypothetical protein